ncbi:hypothetical protein ACIHAA_02110 [Streptomyces sp. NPDC052040]
MQQQHGARGSAPGGDTGHTVVIEQRDGPDGCKFGRRGGLLWVFPGTL